MAQSILLRLLNNLNLFWHEWLKINIVPKKKGAGRVGIGSLFCRRMWGFTLSSVFGCFIEWREEENTCTQASQLHYKQVWFMPLCSLYHCVLTFCCTWLPLFWSNTYFHLNAENCRQLFLSLVLQRGQVCSIKVASEFKSSVFWRVVLWAHQHSADISKAPSSNRHLWWNI